MINPEHTLVTGGAGFIGSHLVESLLRTGGRVTVIDDLSTGSLENLHAADGDSRFQMRCGRVSEQADLPQILGGCTAAYHLAASVGVDLVMTAPIQTIRNNVHETEVLLEAASQARVPVILTSSSEVYGKSRQAEFNEEDDLLIGPPHLGRWRYACSKLMDEFLALAYAEEKQLPVVITRLFNIVGPRQTGRYGMVLPRFIKAALQNQPVQVFGDGTQTRCFCYIDDAITALRQLQKCPQAYGEVFNIGGTEEISILHLAQLVIRTLHSKSSIEMVPYEQAYYPGFEDMLRRKPLVDKLMQLIGLCPARSLTDIIQSTADRIREEIKKAS